MASGSGHDRAGSLVGGDVYIMLLVIVLLLLAQTALLALIVRHLRVMRSLLGRTAIISAPPVGAPAPATHESVRQSHIRSS
jgi:hypothetical protein